MRESVKILTTTSTYIPEIHFNAQNTDQNQVATMNEATGYIIHSLMDKVGSK